MTLFTQLGNEVLEKSDAIKNYVAILRELHFSDADIYLFSAYFQGFLSDYMFSELQATFTDTEVKALDFVATEEKFTNREKLKLFEVAFEDKKGKSLIQIIDELLEEFTNTIRKNKEQLDTFLASSDPTEDDKTQLKKLEAFLQETFIPNG